MVVPMEAVAVGSVPFLGRSSYGQGGITHVGRQARVKEAGAVEQAMGFS
jgi:hypothetical protein